MKRSIKMIICIPIVIALALACICNELAISGYCLEAEIISDDSSYCGVIPDGEKYKELNCYSGEAEIEPTRTLPSYVNLSTDPCFPPLGNQGSLSSCVAFATTYYQFTYEVNKMNNVTSTTDRVIYSPKWTYNMINWGVDFGASITNAYAVLERFGALKLSDLPYDTNYTWIPGNLNISNNEMKNERIEALNTRVSNLQTLTLHNYGTQITSPTDTDLQSIKTALASGKLLTICTNIGTYCMDGKDHNNNTVKITYRFNNAGGHAMTVVGYDDDASCDVNGNGMIETCEKGAFILADSYGSSGQSYDTNGYMWVLYDAINAVSANTLNNWESGLSDRAQAFSQATSQPTFWMISVSPFTPYFVGDIFINTGSNMLSEQQFKIGRALGSSTVTYTPYDILPNGREGTYRGSFFCDYGDLCTPIHSQAISYLSGYDWYTNFSSLNCNYRLKIIDNKQNLLATSVYTNSTNPKHVMVNTRIGDVNYNGVINSYDAQMVMGYDASTVQLSHLQKVLADFNQDGVINMSDYVGIIQYIAGGGS